MNQNFDIFYDIDNNVYQVRTKSEAFIFEFLNKEEECIFLKIVDLYRKANVYTYQFLKEELKEYEDSKVIDVIQELQSCELLNERNLQEAKVNQGEHHNRYDLWNGLIPFASTCKLGFIGHCQLCDLVFDKAKNMGYTIFNCIKTPCDNHTEEELSRFIEGQDFIVMDATYWSPRMLSTFNSLMLLTGKPWIYVDGMIDSVHYSLGPIFHGEETGCYECLESRIESNDYNRAFSLSYKKYLEENNEFSKNTIVSLPIEEIVANLIMMEINKCILGIGVPETWRNILLFNTHNYSITKHYFLKNPLCTSCHPRLSYTNSPWLENIILKK